MREGEPSEAGRQAIRACCSRGCSARLEEKNSDLAKVEIDEVLGLVGHIGAEVTADNAMPGGVVLLVELLLDVGRDVLLNVVLLQGLGGAVDSILESRDKFFRIHFHFHNLRSSPAASPRTCPHS